MMLIAAALLVPLAGALILPLFRFTSRRKRAWYVEFVVLMTSALAFALVVKRPEETLTVLKMSETFALSFRVDGLSCVFTGLVAFLWPLASLYAFEYMEHESRENAFFCFYTLSYTVTLAISMAENLFTLYMFYECLTFVTLPLVTHKRNTLSIHAGRKYIYYSLTGAALVFMGMMVLTKYGAGIHFTLGGSGLIFSATAAASKNLLLAVFVVAFIGFSVKSAMFPLHAWLPAASVAPTPVTALLHAVAVVNAGAYAAIRLVYYTYGTKFLFGTWGQTVVLVLAAMTIVYGSARAVREQHLKRRLAYSTVSNLSYILLGAAVMTPAGMVGAMTHMICHGLIKITLFYCAGAILVKTEQEYVQDVRGLAKVMPFTFGIFTLASLGLVGVPPLAGFLSKWNLLTAASSMGIRLGLVGIFALIISAILTAIYLMNVVVSAYFMPLNPELHELTYEKHDPSWRMKLPLTILSVMIVLVGLFGSSITQWLTQIATGII